MRASITDYAVPIMYGNTRIGSSLGRQKIDPWGFLLPLTPLVWAAILTALLGILAALQLLLSSLQGRTLSHGGWPANALNCVRVILQQGKGIEHGAQTRLNRTWLSHILSLIYWFLSSRGCGYDLTIFVSYIPNVDIVIPAEWWWSERLLLGLWMLTTLVLAKSYAGNLMSLLAVRYFPQPFHTLRDVLNDPHVAMIWHKYSRNEQFLKVSAGNES